MVKQPKPQKSVTLVPQRRLADCAVAVLAGYLSLPYTDVSAVARHVVPDFAEHGMTTREMLKIARQLGHPLKRDHKYSYIDAVGIADMVLKGKKFGHFAILNRGLILDSEGSIAVPVDVYLEQQRAKIAALYVLKG